MKCCAAVGKNSPKKSNLNFWTTNVCELDFIKKYEFLNTLYTGIKKSPFRKYIFFNGCPVNLLKKIT